MANTGGNFYRTSFDRGLSWSGVNTLTGGVLFGALFANNLFVLVGGFGAVGNGIIYTSPDGITWTSRTNPKRLNINSVTYGNGLYVAVGGNDVTDAYIVTSPDLVTWTERANPSSNALNSITWTGSNFVAVGNADVTDAYIVTSPDGITWTERANPLPMHLRSVTYGLGKVVAVGEFIGSAPYVVTSLDNGVTWVAGTIRGVGGNLLGVTLTGLVFVACGNGAVEASGLGKQSIFISTDGASWSFSGFGFSQLAGGVNVYEMHATCVIDRKLFFFGTDNNSPSAIERIYFNTINKKRYIPSLATR